nr:1925_t:CDS:2 [Entrophospora candida]
MVALLEKSKMFGIPMGIRYGFMAFEQCSLSVPANEPLDPQEAKWISDTMRGGLILAKNEWKGYGRQYDFTSMYPY